LRGRYVNPADKRLSELIEKWLTSLELHLKYSGLDEATYWKVQPWVKHERPSRWIIELARQKALSLKEQVEGRIAMGDAKFSDALELMGFLTNLVGSQHIARFIPLAEPQSEQDPKTVATASSSPTVSASAAVAIGDSTRVASLTTQPRAALVEATREMPRAAPKETPRPADATREMPRLPAGAPASKAAPRADTRKAGARRDSKASEMRVEAPRDQKARAGASARDLKARSNDAGRDLKVIADAVRLLGWGRQWHELPELISRMADRPALSEVRRILRDNKAAIDAQRSKG